MRFDRSLLPDPASYYEAQGLRLTGPRSAKWRTTACSFHGGSDSMSINLRTVMADPAMIASGVAMLMVVKFALLFVLGRWPGRLDTRGALLLGSVLALGGEFAFVVFGQFGGLEIAADGLLIDSGKRDPAGHRIVGSQIVGLDGSGGRAWNS